MLTSAQRRHPATPCSRPACHSRCPPTVSGDIWKHKDHRAFCNGLVPFLLGIFSYAGIDRAVYETLKDVSRKYIIKDSVQQCCVTVSGALGATFVSPLQVIRTRLQAQRGNSEAECRGMSEVFWRIIQHESVSEFYKGILPNLLKAHSARAQENRTKSTLSHTTGSKSYARVSHKMIMDEMRFLQQW